MKRFLLGVFVVTTSCVPSSGIDLQTLRTLQGNLVNSHNQSSAHAPYQVTVLFLSGKIAMDPQQLGKLATFVEGYRTVAGAVEITVGPGTHKSRFESFALSQKRIRAVGAWLQKQGLKSVTQRFDPKLPVDTLRINLRKVDA